VGAGVVEGVAAAGVAGALGFGGTAASDRGARDNVVFAINGAAGSFGGFVELLCSTARLVAVNVVGAAVTATRVGVVGDLVGSATTTEVSASVENGGATAFVVARGDVTNVTDFPVAAAGFGGVVGGHLEAGCGAASRVRGTTRDNRTTKAAGLFLGIVGVGNLSVGVFAAG
jgi:hypothetical protein